MKIREPVRDCSWRGTHTPVEGVGVAQEEAGTRHSGEPGLARAPCPNLLCLRGKMRIPSILTFFVLSINLEIMKKKFFKTVIPAP